MGLGLPAVAVEADPSTVSAVVATERTTPMHVQRNRGRRKRTPLVTVSLRTVDASDVPNTCSTSRESTSLSADRPLAVTRVLSELRRNRQMKCARTTLITDIFGVYMTSAVSELSRR